MSGTKTVTKNGKEEMNQQEITKLKALIVDEINKKIASENKKLKRACLKKKEELNDGEESPVYHAIPENEELDIIIEICEKYEYDNVDNIIKILAL